MVRFSMSRSGNWAALMPYLVPFSTPAPTLPPVQFPLSPGIFWKPPSCFKMILNALSKLAIFRPPCLIFVWVGQELVQLDGAVVCVLYGEQALPRVLQPLGVVYAEEFLVSFQALWLVETVPYVVEVPVHINFAPLGQALFERTVRTVTIR